MDIIDDLQNKVYQLIGYTGSENLAELSKYNCSEVSRLIGIDIFRRYGEKSQPTILKGTWKGGNSHDVLVYFDEFKKKYILVDPTIWQFFNEAKSIYWGVFESIDDCIEFLSQKYICDWQISELLGDISFRQEKELRKVLEQNLTDQD